MNLVLILEVKKMTRVTNPNCDNDKCGRSSGEVRLLPTGGGGNAILCHRCFNYEMSFRRVRIEEGVEFDLPEWESLPVYDAS